MKAKIPDYKILAAGVAGYGTDQEYLLLKRLWPKVKPAAVVLIFCAQNDRLDNSANVRYDSYRKPYFATQPDGSVVLMDSQSRDLNCYTSRTIGWYKTFGWRGWRRTSMCGSGIRRCPCRTPPKN